MEHNAFYYYEQAMDYLYSVGEDVAKSNLDSAVNLEPDNLDYRNKRGMLRYEGYQFLLAIEDFTKIIEGNAEIGLLTHAYDKRCFSYYQIKEYRKAIADLDWLINQDSVGNHFHQDFSRYYQRRAESKLRLKDYAESIKDFTIANQLSPKNEHTLSFRASAYRELGLYKKAEADLSEILEFSNNNWSIYHMRGLVYFITKEYLKALTDFNEVARLRSFELYKDATDYMREFLPEFLDSK